MKVLLVDDSQDVLVLIARILRKAEAQVTTAESVAEAYRAFLETPFDLVISDIGMPGEDGLCLIRRIRSLENENRLQRVPAIALSAFTQTQDHLKSLEAGFDCHLNKPVSTAQLLEVSSSLAKGTFLLPYSPEMTAVFHSLRGQSCS